MARFAEPTLKEETEWKKWVASRPKKVRKIAERFEPWSLYRLGENRVTIYSFSEDGTLTVSITADWNSILFERQVFGVNPDDLSPCDLPEKSELLGSALSTQEVEENLDQLRVMIRPDLWELDKHGNAIKKNQHK